MARLINQSLVSYFQVQADYTCSKDSPRKISEHLDIKWTGFVSSRTFSVVIYIFFRLLASKKK